MEAGVNINFKAASLNVTLTDYESIEEAVTAFMEGKIKNLHEERTY